MCPRLSNTGVTHISVLTAKLSTMLSAAAAGAAASRQWISRSGARRLVLSVRGISPLLSEPPPDDARLHALGGCVALSGSPDDPFKRNERARGVANKAPQPSRVLIAPENTGHCACHLPSHPTIPLFRPIIAGRGCPATFAPIVPIPGWGLSRRARFLRRKCAPIR